jgi:pimeloyl-ACP methyl ester carboxylesterase
MHGAPEVLSTLADRFDATAFDAPAGRARLRLRVTGDRDWDATVEHGLMRLTPANGARPDARLAADAATWRRIADDVRGGMEAFSRGKLKIRDDLHLGVGFLAATSGMTGPERLVLDRVATEHGEIALMQAGQGDPVLLLHGLGATKASFLPTIAALAGSFRVTAIDLPGFGDSAMPVGAAYDPPFFARAVAGVLDALEIERAHLIGNSMGGRIALELGFDHPERTGQLALLAPSLAWLRERRWATLLRAVRPELGLIQPAPRVIVDRIARAMVPGGNDGWSAVGVDEFLRGYLTPRGRAAFYAAARNIYLEDPNRFWSRLRELQGEALFVWGRQDKIVPIGFARHVRDALPAAEHLELDCGHVPQLEAPRATHAAVRDLLSRAPLLAPR